VEQDKNNKWLEPGSLKASFDIGVDKLGSLQLVTSLPIPTLPLCDCPCHPGRNEVCHLGNLRDEIWFCLKAKHLQGDLVPLLSLYEVDKSKLPVWFGSRLDNNVVLVLVLSVDDIFQERSGERDARPVDSLQYTAIVAVIGGRMYDLTERFQRRFLT
jgi:hypothetical protein